TRMSNFWFARTAHLVPNHLSGRALDAVLPPGVNPDLYAHRSVVCRRLHQAAFEAHARGYLIRSGWQDYQASGALCGIPLPRGLRQAERVPEPLFTPSTKAAVGGHDENVGFEVVANRVGRELADRVREATLAIYAFAADYAAQRGILIA